MRILHTVESYLPARHGMSEVVRQISERLVGRGHEVTVATARDPARGNGTIEGVRVEEFGVEGKAATGLRGEVARYQRFLIDSSYDVVVNFAAQQWATDLALPILREIRARKVFVPTGFSGLYLKEFQEYFREMPTWMREYDLNVFLSQTYRDARFADEHGIDNRVLIPNGAAAEEFLPDPAVDIRSKLGIDEGALVVLHVGDFTGSKGHLETVEIFTRARISNAVLLLVSERLAQPAPAVSTLRSLAAVQLGRWPARQIGPGAVHAAILRGRFANSRRGKRIAVAALSRDEAVAAFKAADIFLFPSNVECSPIVLFEAMAARAPFLSTDAGNAAEIVDWSGAGEILPTKPLPEPSGWVEADVEASTAVLERLVADEPRRRRMAEAGFAAWRERFTWERVAEEYEHAYATLLSR